MKEIISVLLICLLGILGLHANDKKSERISITKKCELVGFTSSESDFKAKQEEVREVNSVVEKGAVFRKKIKIKPAAILNALANACVQVGVITAAETQEEKEQGVCNLLATAFAVAAQVADGNSKSVRRGDIISKIVQLVENLYVVIKADGVNIYRVEGDSYLRKIFALQKEQDRKELTYVIINSRKKATDFLQEIFSTLFSYCSDILAIVKEDFYEKIKNLFNEEEREINRESCFANGICRISSSIINKSLNSDDFCVGSFVGERRIYSDEYVPLVLVRILFDLVPMINMGNFYNIGITVGKAGSLVGYKNDAFNKEDSISILKEKIAWHLSLLISEAKKAIAKEDSLATFLRMGDFVSHLDVAKTDCEREKIIYETIFSKEVGIKFIDEAFLYVHLYLQEKLSDVFADVFGRVISIVGE